MFNYKDDVLIVYL